MPHHRERFTAHLNAAAEQDTRLREILDRHGYPEPRQRSNSFETMLRIIVSQQLSTRVASVIWDRLATLCAPEVAPQTILSLEPEALRSCGLSRQKVDYTRALAERIHSGTLNPGSREDMPLEQALDELTRIRGYGRWSAEIYAMFALGHADVFPAGDLALQIAIQRLESMQEKPSEKQARVIAQRWSPYQSAVAVLMWHYYGAATLDWHARGS